MTVHTYVFHIKHDAADVNSYTTAVTAECVCACVPSPTVACLNSLQHQNCQSVCYDTGASSRKIATAVRSQHRDKQLISPRPIEKDPHLSAKTTRSAVRVEYSCGVSSLVNKNPGGAVCCLPGLPPVVDLSVLTHLGSSASKTKRRCVRGRGSGLIALRVRVFRFVVQCSVVWCLSRCHDQECANHAAPPFTCFVKNDEMSPCVCFGSA